MTGMHATVAFAGTAGVAPEPVHGGALTRRGGDADVQVARVLRRQRAERGALQLASPEVKFEIDTETHDPLDVGMYQVRLKRLLMHGVVPLAPRPCAC